MSHSNPYMPNYDQVVRKTWGEVFEKMARDMGATYVDWSHTHATVIVHESPDNCPTWAWYTRYSGDCRCMVEPL